jgi:hypothetical protein
MYGESGLMQVLALITRRIAHAGVGVANIYVGARMVDSLSNKKLDVLW